jgi:hypothetical protein
MTLLAGCNANVSNENAFKWMGAMTNPTVKLFA